jgi:ADP-ribose pyrophosphatase
MDFGAQWKMDSSSDQRIASYLALRDQRPGVFDGPPDGIRIALDPEEIAAIETEVAIRYEQNRWPRQWATAGLCYQDPYLRLIRDAVVFPDGYRGIHHRVLSSDVVSGAAVLPLHQDRLVLLRHFRHPTRRWHWEIPRGAIEAGSTAEQTARDELREEIGAEAETLTPLGLVHGSSALVSGAAALYFATITAPGQVPLHEGISGFRHVTLSEIESMIAQGDITDSFTLAAVLKARLAGLI